MKSYPYLLPALFVSLILGAGCYPELDIYGPEKELYGIYGVLDPALDTQRVRIGQVFRVNGDAYVFSGDNDLSVNDLSVTVEGAGKRYEAFLDVSQPKDSGMFHPGLSHYTFLTTGADRLQPGEVYTLHVRHPDDDSLNIWAETRIPYNPRIVSPGPHIYSPATGQYSYNTVEFNDDATFTFEKGQEEGYEFRVFVKYWDGEKITEFRWGPSRISFESEGCVGNVFYNRTCFRIPGRSLPTTFAAAVSQSPGIPYMVDTVRTARALDSLSHDTRLELTVVDKHLSNYLNGVTPFGFGLNLLLDKKDYTNISGGHAGIFGAIQRKQHYIFLGECTVYQAGLLGAAPIFCN